MEQREPIDRIEWRRAEALNPNLWNPNIVATPELRLLELNLLKHGWIQPIIVNGSGIIVDGFHRWRLSLDPGPVRERWAGLVPCTVLELDDESAMLLTVRMNRAKGFHVATRMADLVKRLLAAGVDPQRIAVELGATADEVTVLSAESVFKARNLKDYKYSRAWYPVEAATRPADLGGAR